MVDFPTRKENTLNLIFTSHPGFKIRCKPLPPIGIKSDHDIVLFDTSHQTYRPRPTCRKIFLWKRADLDGLRASVATASNSFLTTGFEDIESMWAAFKTVITEAVDQHVPTKFTSTRRTHPWVKGIAKQRKEGFFAKGRFLYERNILSLSPLIFNSF